MNLLKKRKLGHAILSTLFMVLGIIVLFWPTADVALLCYALGGIAILSGIWKIIFYFLIPQSYRTTTDFVYGIAFCLIGLLTIIFAEQIISVYPIAAGLVLVVVAATKLGYSLELKIMKVKSWWINTIEAILPALLGITIVVLYVATEGIILVYTLGAIFVLEGLCNLMFIFYLEHKVKTIKNELKSIEPEILYPPKQPQS